MRIACKILRSNKVASVRDMEVKRRRRIIGEAAILSKHGLPLRRSVAIARFPHSTSSSLRSSDPAEHGQDLTICEFRPRGQWRGPLNRQAIFPELLPGYGFDLCWSNQPATYSILAM
jgi:hypothetical protein